MVDFDLRDVAVTQRVRAYSHWVRTQFGLSVTDMKPTHGTARMFELGPACLWYLQSPAALAMRGGNERRAREAGGLFYQVSGTTTFRCGAREYQLAAGEIGVGATSLSSGFEIVCSEDAEQVMLRLPREMLSARHPWLQDAPVLYGAGEPGVRLLTEALLGALRDAPSLNVDQSSLLFTSLTQLAGLPRVATTHAHEEDYRVRRALHMIEEQLHDPALDAPSVAAVCGLSRRRLDQLFARDVGMAVSARIAEARVTRAAELLAAACNASVSITEVAYATGFSDSAQFSRAFGKRFDRSPSRYRRTRLAAARTHGQSRRGTRPA